MDNERKFEPNKFESCYIESRNISKNVMRLINLAISRSQGTPVDDEIDGEVETLINNELRLKRCILRELKT